MAAKSGIEWTATINADGSVTPGATWTPLQARRRDNGKTGVHCERVSPACKNCYAARFNMRNLPSHGTGLDFTIINRPKVDIVINEQILLQPLKWRRPRKIFVNSQTDTWGDFVEWDQIDLMMAVAAMAKDHTFQFLTKRAERLRDYMTHECTERRIAELVMLYRYTRDFNSTYEFDARDAELDEWPLPNVWLGVTAENQEWADKRIPMLLQTPAAKRFVSAEPLLGPVDLSKMPFSEGDKRHTWCALTGQALLYADGVDGHPDMTIRMEKPIYPHINWIITGGESGPGARPSHPDWFRSLLDQCQAAGVAFFFKQWGDWSPRGPESMGYPLIDGVPTFRLTYDGRNGQTCEGENQMWMQRVGKKADGRLLDGRTWDEFPEVCL